MAYSVQLCMVSFGFTCLVAFCFLLTLSYVLVLNRCRFNLTNNAVCVVYCLVYAMQVGAVIASIYFTPQNSCQLSTYPVLVITQAEILSATILQLVFYRMLTVRIKLKDDTENNMRAFFDAQTSDVVLMDPLEEADKKQASCANKFMRFLAQH